MTFINRPTARLTCTILLASALGACGDSGGGDTGGATDPGTTGDAPTGSSGATDPGTTGATTADEPTGAGSTDATTGGATTTDATTADATTADATTDATTGGGGVADCGFDPAVVYGRTELIFQLVSADGETCVWLRRRDDSEPDIIYKAVPYTLLEFKAGHDGAVDHFTDEATLAWESTHHNWADVATAWDADVRYRLEDWYGQSEFTDLYKLSAHDAQTDALLWGPVELTPYTP